MAICLALSLTACHLVDQRDFNPHAGEKPVFARPVAAPVPPRPALVTIGFATPDPNYQPALREAVRQVLARKADAAFIVTTTAPVADDLEAAADTGRQVAQSIVDAGVPPAHIEQVLTSDKLLAAREVRVTVR